MALYRKYRPASFAEVVGQDHVTVPLSTALDSGHINHAYLFSGPRGCGKTSSARILARSLNCVEGPTSTPCGECDSCIALAPGGAGTVDVMELDAATHNGVDDMRELRDHAFYAPAEARYRVFIIDEAHMISSAGFNALLKIVEEPPEHLIFIFATTEPEKLLATIRSRTHNYPFRLLTPPDMRRLLEGICEQEGVSVEDNVYPLVIRAGGGSPRDSLSIMDQLLAGSDEQGVTYERAVALLGVTDSALIDRAVDALSPSSEELEQGSGQGELFSVVADVIDAGYDPRRFAMDLLDRLRDLLVVQAVGAVAFQRGLVDVPNDQQEKLLQQVEGLGYGALTRCAAIVNDGLSQMKGATSPRLLLEIMCARMILPAAGATIESLAQRVEVLEKTGGASTSRAESQRSSEYERPSVRREREKNEREREERRQQEEEQSVSPVGEESVSEDVRQARAARHIIERRRQERNSEQKHAGEETQPEQDSFENLWATILESSREDLNIYVSARGAQVDNQSSQYPRESEPGRLILRHSTGALASYVNKHAGILNTAAEKLTGARWSVEAVVGAAVSTAGGALGASPQKEKTGEESAPAVTSTATTTASSSNQAVDSGAQAAASSGHTEAPSAQATAPSAQKKTDEGEPAYERSSQASSALERAKAFARQQQQEKEALARETTRREDPQKDKKIASHSSSTASTPGVARASSASFVETAPSAETVTEGDYMPVEPPPEPGDYQPGDYPPPEEEYSPQEDYEDYLQDRSAPNYDHRSALEVATELISNTLGGSRIN